MELVVYVEANPARARVVTDVLAFEPFELVHVDSAAAFRLAVTERPPAVLLLGQLPEASRDAMIAAAECTKALVVVIGASAEELRGTLLTPIDVLTFPELWRLAPTLLRILGQLEPRTDPEAARDDYARGLERLGLYATRLARARTPKALADEIRQCAAEIAGSDDVVVMERRDDAIAPVLGQFQHPRLASLHIAPQGSLASRALDTWAPVVLEDVEVDPRVSTIAATDEAGVAAEVRDVVASAGIRSLAFLPVLVDPPTTVLVVAWARRHRPTARELALLQALANLAAVALENLALVEGLERRIERRTAALRRANAELEAYNHAVAHDVRAPALSVIGFSDALRSSAPGLGDTAARHLARIGRAARQLVDRVDSLLELSRAVPHEITRTPCDLTALAEEIAAPLVEEARPRVVRIDVAPDLRATIDARLAAVIFDNLLRNAIKFTRDRPVAYVEVGFDDDARAYFVRDDGIGFDPARAEEMFRPFRRLHGSSAGPGMGIGLATVRRAVGRAGGHVWAEGRPDRGATIYFTLPPA